MNTNAVISCFGIFLILVFAACRTLKIKSDRLYRQSKSGRPTVLLFKDSSFSFNYVVPNRFNYTGPARFPEKYFITKGGWKLNKGVLILTSSSDSLAHSIEDTHPIISPFVKKPVDPNISMFVFNDIWGDSIQIYQVEVDNKPVTTNIDTMYKFYTFDITANVDVIKFYFKKYEPYTFRNSEKINKDYDITLQPKYSRDFFQNDTFHLTRKKFIDIRRNLELVRLR